MYDRFPEVKHFTEISRDMIEDYLVLKYGADNAYMEKAWYRVVKMQPCR